jgi:hypothetical protein
MEIRREFVIKTIRIVNKTKVVYDYEYSSTLKKYFCKKNTFFVEYDTDVSDVPNSILAIPFLANVLPISWFVGFGIFISELDVDFFNSAEIIKSVFLQQYPETNDKISHLRIKNLVLNNVEVNHTAMLFSGGVDSYATYFRHIKEDPDLITIHGADISIDNLDHWHRLLKQNNQEPIISNNKKYTIKSNIRNFYTYNVDILLSNLGWWGEVQHGLSLSCLLAPLSFKNGYQRIYIASSYNDNIKISWGSSPEIDNHIKWANTRIIHDGYELTRQEKVEMIVKNLILSKKKLNLRVCYSELNKGINCSECEKCYRTILGIILSNADPNKFGFKVTEKVYEDILELISKGYFSKGTEYFWLELNEKIKEKNTFYIFKNREEEIEKINLISSLITRKKSEGINKTTKLGLIKFRIINCFPKLFKYYLKFRQK